MFSENSQPIRKSFGAQILIVFKKLPKVPCDFFERATNISLISKCQIKLMVPAIDSLK